MAAISIETVFPELPQKNIPRPIFIKWGRARQASVLVPDWLQEERARGRDWSRFSQLLKGIEKLCKESVH
jgi:hypothetical protein